MSSALWLSAPSSALAHEVLPAIADMTQSEGQLTFDLSANLESFVAGIDLAEVADTNEAPQAATYDELHALPPAELDTAFREFWPQMAERITIKVDGTALTPTLTAVEVPEVENPELVRTSEIQFTVDLPPGAESVVVGWDRAFGTLVIRQMGVDAPYDGYLEAGAQTPPITLAGGDQAGPWQTFVNYIPVGFDHIVPLGLDHILFVLGLFFLSTKMGPLLWQISAFTLAHTITLALAALGYVSVPGSIVEPLIAASIVFVAVENIFARGLSPWRPVVIFGFGLLHGLGFASVLGEFGLPPGSFVPALIGFNIGVELGQLAVVAVAFLIVREAIRVDMGRNEAGLATGLYGVGTLVAGALAVAAFMVPGFLGGDLMGEIPLWNFFVPLTLLAFLCLLSVLNRDQLDAYRRIVAVPASVAIAIVGAYWFVERVFL
ncbi:hypothetical protein LOM8899_01572 [Flavimaricola marinus]|uniref:HupE / UreJ protein n=2 Tax=Flavimaricola marinus TaxID=1819565 RepID=A0A238LCJ0_9RHOB|nr:hypothetical protein LOM8899_01572 [Flavimaricola marinus]